MIGVLPVSRIISAVAVCYAVLVALSAALALTFGGVDQGPRSVAALALSGGTLLQLIVLAILSVGWRWLWRALPFLNRAIFPDLNGEWEMDVHWRRGKKQGTVRAQATIRQDCLKISVDVVAPGSDSHTLAVSARKDPESQRPQLIYVFRVEPKGDASKPDLPYRGSAVLRHYREEECDVLRGKYWTELPSHGDYELRRAK